MEPIEKATQLAWRKFYLTENAVKGMLWLRESAPVVQKGPECEMVFDSGRVQGYTDCLNKISEMLAANPAPDKPLESASELEPTRNQ
jgi:hypothetical protein